MNDRAASTATAAQSGEDTGLFALIHAGRMLEARVERALAGVGLSLAKHGVLTLLVEAGEPLALSDLAARQSCVRSNITQLVDRLEADGLVRRVHDAADRRVIRAAVTAEGERRQAAGAVELDKLRVEFARELPAADRAVLERLLAALR